MKKSNFFVILFTGLFSFNAFSQSELNIVNITENQEVSGNLVVKLDTSTIKRYRIASYYVDDTFLSTIYDSPFTFQFDTRDFENGKHTLFIKASRVDGIVDIDQVEVKVNNTKPAFNLLVNNVRRFASVEQVPIGGSFIDAPHSILKKNEKEFFILAPKKTEQ